MGVRKAINDHPAVSASIGGALCLFLVVLLVWEAGGARTTALAINAKFANKAVYSDDDGKTLFVDDAAQVSPFEHDGKTAYRVMLFQCGGDKPFVGYLEKYSPAEIKSIASLKAAEAQRDPNSPPNSAAWSNLPMELKKPSDMQWLSATATDPRQTVEYHQILVPRCADGSAASTAWAGDADIR